jgi:hypothetical protein
MKTVYIGFDDTDNLDADVGTGKLARRFEALLPEGCRLRGVVRQQLLVDDRIPYTSHNSSACLIVEVPDIATQGEGRPPHRKRVPDGKRSGAVSGLG